MNLLENKYSEYFHILFMVLVMAFFAVSNSITISFLILIAGVGLSVYLAYREGFVLSLLHDKRKPYFLLNIFQSIVIIICLIVAFFLKNIDFLVWIAISGIFLISLSYLAIYFYAFSISIKANYETPLDDSILMGHTIKDTFSKPFYIPEEVRNLHQIIYGTTGMAKTVGCLYPQIEHDIRTGKVVIILDPKGDKKFRNRVFGYCQEYKRDFRYFSITNPKYSHFYNPFNFGDAGQIKDKIISITDWPDQGDGTYYKKIAQHELMKAALSIEENITISKLLETIPDNKELKGLKADLEIINLYPFSYLMDCNYGIKDIYDQDKVFFISLDEDSYPEISLSLGKIVLSDLKALSGYINNKIDEQMRKPLALYIDEAASFMSDYMGDHFLSFMAKTRSANMYVTLVTHGPVGDFDCYGTHIKDRFSSLASTIIVLRNGAPDSAEYLARLFGTKKAEKLTRQISNSITNSDTGLGSLREGEEFKVSPNKIKSLQKGDAIISISEGGILESVFLDHHFHDNQKGGVSYENYVEENGLINLLSLSGGQNGIQ